MLNQPLVSIIIPTYNYGGFIAETIICLQVQKYTNWEAIVIDDGSTDNTKAVVQKFSLDKRILYLYQQNAGLPAARNAGIKIAKGSYIQFLDSDDLISEEKLLRQVNFMEHNPEVDISYSDAYYFKGADKQHLFRDMKLGNKEWMPKLNERGFTIIKKLINKNIMPVNAALIKREVFSNVGLQNVTLKSFEDWEFWIRCAILNKFFTYFQEDKAFALVRVHSTSMSQNRMVMSESEVVLRKTIENLLPEAPLPNSQKTELRNLNNRKTQDSYRSYILKDGYKRRFFYKKFGLIAFIRVYFKALNEYRRDKIN